MVLAAKADLDSYEATVQAAEGRIEVLRAEVDRLRSLITYAVLLHENGERPPGHETATWGDWYTTLRADEEAAR